ncbi:MAG: hypothetical protein EBQ66_02415 [Flavobacteriia bacterium]|nr:hypothetical protein [Flavobacteriia bacterium]
MKKYQQVFGFEKPFVPNLSVLDLLSMRDLWEGTGSWHKLLDSVALCNIKILILLKTILSLKSRLS